MKFNIIIFTALRRVVQFRFRDQLRSIIAHSVELPYSLLVLGAWFFGACIPLLHAELLSAPYLVIAAVSLTLLGTQIKSLLTIAALVCGVLWVSMTLNQHADNILPAELERIDMQLEGRVIGLPRTQDGNVKFRLMVTRSQLNQTLEGQRLQLSCYRCPMEIMAGQLWSMTVRLKRPHGYASWGAFDYEKYLYRHRLIAVGYVRTKSTAMLMGRKANSFAKIREYLRSNIYRAVAVTDQSKVGLGIITALAIGDKSGLTQQQRKVFQVTGISHLMAISGLHVGLVFVCISFLLRIVFRPIAAVYEYIPRPILILPFALGGSFFYSALAGFSVSTQRALLMLCVFVLCKLMARDVSLLKVLAISVFVLTFIDPFSILDAGFWLSCGAVLVIAVTSDLHQSQSLLRLQPKIWLGMLPLSSLLFGQVSLLSPVVNLLMVPLFCVLLIPATLVSVIMLILMPQSLGIELVEILSWVYWRLYQMLEWLAQLSYAKKFTLEWQPSNWCAAILVASTFAVSRWKKHFVLELLHIGAWLIFLYLLFFSVSAQSDDELRVSLLDVGQGLSMVVEARDYVLVYDTGPRYGSGFSVAEAVVLPYLRSRGISKIDSLIISHADNDHIGGFRAVYDAFAVSEVLTSRVDKLPMGKECLAGQSWRRGITFFSIVAPDGFTPKGSNNRSCVLLIQHGKTKVLITGDIEKQVERNLLSRGLVPSADILLVPHQGSKTSSTPDFIDAVRPKLALIAAGYLNHYGHPHTTVVDRYQLRGIDLVSSADNGSVLLKINQEGWARESYRVVKRRFWHHQKLPNWD